LCLRKAQVLVARALGLDDVAARLSHLLFPGLYHELNSAAVTDALKAATFQHTGYAVALHQWRRAQTSFCVWIGGYHPHVDDFAHFEQRGHGVETGMTNYTGIDSAPTSTAAIKLKSHLRVSRCWHDLTGWCQPSL